MLIAWQVVRVGENRNLGRAIQDTSSLLVRHTITLYILLYRGQIFKISKFPDTFLFVFIPKNVLVKFDKNWSNLYTL